MLESFARMLERKAAEFGELDSDGGKSVLWKHIAQLEEFVEKLSYVPVRVNTKKGGSLISPQNSLFLACGLGGLDSIAIWLESKGQAPLASRLETYEGKLRDSTRELDDCVAQASSHDELEAQKQAVEGDAATLAEYLFTLASLVDSMETSQTKPNATQREQPLPLRASQRGRPGQRQLPMGKSKRSRRSHAQGQEPDTLGTDPSLGTAIVAVLTLRDLSELRLLYPGSVDAEEARDLHDRLVAALELALETGQLKDVTDDCQLPGYDDQGGPGAWALLGASLVLRHPRIALRADGGSNAEVIVRDSELVVSKMVRELVCRIHEIMWYDCQLPGPDDEPTFQEPARYMQMLQMYWGLCRILIENAERSPANYAPHPLIPLILNLRGRIEACWEKLDDCEDITDAKEAVNWFLEVLESGDFDEVQCAGGYTNAQLRLVETALARAQYRMGSKSYPLTKAEEMFIESAQKVIERLKQATDRAWSDITKYLKEEAVKQGRRARRGPEDQRSDEMSPPKPPGEEPDGDTVKKPKKRGRKPRSKPNKVDLAVRKMLDNGDVERYGRRWKELCSRYADELPKQITPDALRKRVEREGKRRQADRK